MTFAAKFIGEKEKRVITVKVFSRYGFAMINVVNYYEGEINFDESGMPVTAGDRRYHGYGIKSVNYIAEQYGGSLTVKTDGGIFAVNVLIPVKKMADGQKL